MNNENPYNNYFYITSPDYQLNHSGTNADICNTEYCEYCEDTTTYDY